MFESVLIANRGEIACRVIRTARRLGLRTIAVYSEADAGARHVRLADEAWLLGPAAPRESYLAIERVLDVAARAGASSIHPGYGFLSENAEFAAACAQAGRAFIGPPASAIAAMGSKSAAKSAMSRAGVPVLPGYHGEAQDLATLVAQGARVGFPLIVKPSGGGGGKGMHIVTQAAELAPALESARRLAGSAFGDATLLLERYLSAPRHVEVQVLADAHGGLVHLGTRDCSVQRRHQKLIEEAPAPGIPDAVRERLHAAALTVARSVGYVNAGTVEFLYADGEFWFMEMNTRLQVEHCVTEQVYGLDLVEWQLRIAANEPLAFAQTDLQARSHAIEVRVCAEDPSAGFVPSAGRIAALDWPPVGDTLRVDAGFDAGDEVPPHYDSLLGKVVATGPTRAAARSALARGLQSFRLAGVASNAEWLARALETPEFAAGCVSTRFVAELGDALAAPAPLDALELAIAAVAWVAPPQADAAQASPWTARDAFRLGVPALQRVSFLIDAAEIVLVVEKRSDGWRVLTDRGEVDLQVDWLGATRLRVTAGERRIAVDVRRETERLHLWSGVRHRVLPVVDRRSAEPESAAHEGALVARLPGTVVAVHVAAGDAVEAGALLMVLEAMKMEHTVLAPRAGVITQVNYAKGERVPESAVLLELAADKPVPGAPVG